MQQSQLVTEFSESFKDVLATQQQYQRTSAAAEKLAKDFNKFSSSKPPEVQELDFAQVQQTVASLGQLGEQLGQQQNHYHQLTQKLEQAEKAERQKKTKLIIFGVIVLWGLYLVF
ncbi:hypothetical protein GKQ23_06490 [Erwinia sp. E602]|uniref:hypothetical protein n=1 Tax=unclassified Erwinia TaxID=2622719 RepID=UPI0006FC955F|nr:MULTISPECIES: hypothetical protein [unclassified Erwinia]KQN54802.1 hypothetical protein ASF13_10150 [Erwinia sp. Leaf53]PLV57736.1 hypothetical protein NV64_15610 [Erwinia sp. B116]QUG74665.1 hypothetical protein GKQ23_06490 [Erwinia sp. E602]